MNSGNYWHLLLMGLLTWSLTVIPGVAAEASPTLDLKEALRLAWRANPTLQISRLHALIAGEEVVRARSGFLPTMKSEASQTINDNEIQVKIPAGTIPGGTMGALSFPTTNRNYWSSKTVIDQTIFDF
jgi:outer membrane protein TolC